MCVDKAADGQTQRSGQSGLATARDSRKFPAASCPRPNPLIPRHCRREPVWPIDQALGW